MQLSTRALALSLTLAGLVVAVPVAWALHTPNQILEEMDRRYSVFGSGSYHATMNVWKTDAKKTTLEFDMTMKDLQKQFITFTAPGDVAGMKILMTDCDTLHIYSPALKKVRSVAADSSEQSFMGAGVTTPDLLPFIDTRCHKAVRTRAEGGVELVELERTRGRGAPKLEVSYDWAHGRVTRVTHRDATGAVVSDAVHDGWQQISGTSFPTRTHVSYPKTGLELDITRTQVARQPTHDARLFSPTTFHTVAP